MRHAHDGRVRTVIAALLIGLAVLADGSAAVAQDESDYDSDGVVDGQDNCVYVVNPDQADRDMDGLGDICDDEPDGPMGDYDDDGDGVVDGLDNCINDVNPDQLDSDEDGQGDACDETPTTETTVTTVPDSTTTVPPGGSAPTAGPEVSVLPSTVGAAGGAGVLPRTGAGTGLLVTGAAGVALCLVGLVAVRRGARGSGA
jgi:hypothetical protein